jgi:hypothetical protein
VADNGELETEVSNPAAVKYWDRRFRPRALPSSLLPLPAPTSLTSVSATAARVIPLAWSAAGWMDPEVPVRADSALRVAEMAKAAEREKRAAERQMAARLDFPQLLSDWQNYCPTILYLRKFGGSGGLHAEAYEV